MLFLFFWGGGLNPLSPLIQDRLHTPGSEEPLGFEKRSGIFWDGVVGFDPWTSSIRRGCSIHSTSHAPLAKKVRWCRLRKIYANQPAENSYIRMHFLGRKSSGRPSKKEYKIFWIHVNALKTLLQCTFSNAYNKSLWYSAHKRVQNQVKLPKALLQPIHRKSFRHLFW